MAGSQFREGEGAVSSVRSTPMLDQYQRLRDANPDALLFFRLGDFYELFGEDAQVAAPILDVQLTTRDKITPMCGVPYHAVDQYLRKLVDAGMTVAIAEQVEDPREAKGLVERKIIRVVSPGTFVDDGSRTPARFAVLFADKREWALAIVELATGTVHLAGEKRTTRSAMVIEEEWERWHPQEYLSNWPDPLELKGRQVKQGRWLQVSMSGGELERFLAEKLGTQSLSAWGLAHHGAAQSAVYILWRYLTHMEQQEPVHLTHVVWSNPKESMLVSAKTLRQLHVFSEDGPSLLSILNDTQTPMGSRLLQSWLERPLTSVAAIRLREQAIGTWMDEVFSRSKTRELLSPVGDLSKQVSRVAMGLATPKDLLGIREGIRVARELHEVVGTLPPHAQGAFPDFEGLKAMEDSLASLKSDVPVKWDEGGLIQDGLDETIDRYRSLVTHQREALAQLEHDEKERSGIKTLKVGYHRTFGYYLEVSRGQVAHVPEDWRRRQTMANAERFTSDALLELERAILDADDKLKSYEYAQGMELLEMVRQASGMLNDLARWLGQIDVFAALAAVSLRRHYRMPVWQEGDGERALIMTGLRHPIMESMTQDFVPSSLQLASEVRVALITGPNMGGKSTFMRAVALNVLLAHIGAPVACEHMELSVFEGVFARIGADDDIYRGQSTFMVEMEEMAWILRQSTPRSLIVLDELGRGTSTFDGMAIAQAVVERLSAEQGPLTLFATHYHELTGLPATRPGVINCSVEVAHDGMSGQLVFTHQIVAGPASRSYGVEVAELAGLPKTVLSRARHLLAEWESRTREMTEPVQQVTLFNPDPIGAELTAALAALDADEISPREAWTFLSDWSGRVKRAKGGEHEPDSHS